jgi:hypothetical protein
LNWIAEYLAEQDVEDVEIWKLLHEEQSRTYGRYLRRLERALGKERRKNRQLKNSKRTLRKVHVSQGGHKRNQLSVPQSVLQRQYANRQVLKGLRYRAWKLTKSIVGYLRTKASGR